MMPNHIQHSSQVVACRLSQSATSHTPQYSLVSSAKLTSYLLLVVRQHLIGSQVLTRCPPLFVVHGVQAVVESRSSMEINNIPQI